MATAGALDLASLASRIQTVAHARAVLGRVTELLREAYERLDAIPTAEGLRDASRDLLDTVNRYAGRIYDEIGTDDPELQTEEISAFNASRVALALHQSNKALQQIEENANTTYWDFVGAMAEVLDRVDTTIRTVPGKITGSLGAAASGALSAFFFATWPWLLAGGVAVGAAFYWRGRLLQAVTA